MTQSYLPVETKINLDEYYEDRYLLFKTNGDVVLYLKYPDYDRSCSENTADYYSKFYGHYQVVEKSGEVYSIHAEFTKDESDHWAANPDCYYSFTFNGHISQLGLDQKEKLKQLR
jgi:hypothetical protein